MKILIINYEYPPLGGGGGVFTRFLAEELAKEHEVDLITSRFGDLPKKEVSGGVNIYRVGVLGRSSLHSAGILSLISFPVTAVLKGLRLLKRKDYDIINTHFAVPSGPAGCLLAKVSGKKNVLNVFGGDIYDPTKKLSPHRNFFLRWVVRRVLNSSSTIIAESNNIAEYAENIYLPEQEVLVIPIGFPEPTRARAEKKEVFSDENKIHLISIGRMVKRKGFDVLIRALSLLPDISRIHLTLIGDGPEAVRLKTLSKDLRVHGAITFSGNVNDDQKFRLLSASDIYVLPSIHEGFGIVLLEAMYYGLAIVATNDGGQTDIIKDKKNGILVPVRDENALADAIIDLTFDADKRKAMGSFNKEDVKKYAISATTKTYVDIFSHLATGSKSNE